MAETITVETTVNAPIRKVWECFTQPEHITKWNSASEDWHTPTATNDLRKGGIFTCRMEARDGSMGFDFAGTYDEVVPDKRLAYTLDDERKVVVTFAEEGGATRVTETFEIEQENSPEMQRAGWQAILDNFKAYAEAH
ncbi:MAG: SRPBCC family protein [Alphaproteobacteria bacterium]